MKTLPPPRPLSVLYGLVLDYFQISLFVDNGICHVIINLNRSLIISEKEYKLLLKDFFANDPLEQRLKYFRFLAHPEFIGSRYWWSRTEKGNRQRIKFLKFLIKKHQKAEQEAQNRYDALLALAKAFDKLLNAITR